MTRFVRRETTNRSGSVEWTYNALGQITQEKKTTAGVVYTIGYAYDLDGNVTQMTYPSGRIVSFGRDSDGYISGITTKKDAGSTAVTLAYDGYHVPFGPLKTVWYGNGLNLWNNLTGDYLPGEVFVNDPSTSTSLVWRGYSRTDGFNLTNIWDNIDTGRNESYWYTASNKLQNASGPWGTLTYYYDGVGNRTYEILDTGSGPTTNVYGYPAFDNRVGAITQGSTTLRSFDYDGAGNVVTDTRGSTAYHYRYNNRGRLDELTVGSTLTADYTYDGLERLAIRATQNMTPAGTTHYVYDLAGHLIAEATDAGNTVREYVWLDDMPFAVVADVGTATPHLYYVHVDQLNRPIKMTDEAKNVVWDAVYWPFGEVYSITGSASNNLRFPGQYFLLESGLHYNWYRHYDPMLGRYTQPDPLGFVNGPSVYAYARSAPANEVDPNGLQIVIPRPGMTPIPPGPYNDEWRNQWEKGLKGLWNFCRKIIAGGGGGDDGKNQCLDRWEGEYGRCSIFKPFGYRYQLACEARANDRLRLCYRNGGKPDPNEPPEYDWQDIPRDSPRR